MLREGSNELICLADKPGDDRFHATCYHESLEAYMARGRELRAEGREGPETLEIRHQEADAGKLEMPSTPATIYNLGGPAEIFDPATGEVSGGNWVWAVRMPLCHRRVHRPPHLAAGSWSPLDHATRNGFLAHHGGAAARFRASPDTPRKVVAQAAHLGVSR